MEIGSEFWYQKPQNNNIKEEKNIDYYFLGRMALKAILQELKQRGISSALFPSYFCESMLAPFYEIGIDISFYNVNYGKGKLVYDIDVNKKFDIFFAINYFGYLQNDMEEIIKEMKEKGKIIIEDNTHSMFTKKIYDSDYVFGSIRKWFPTIAGGVIQYSREKIIIKKEKSNAEFCNKRLHAMKLKKDYIENGKGNKNEYLSLNKEFNDYLEEEKGILDIDRYSKETYENIDIDFIIEKRRKNAEYLHKELKKIGMQTISELKENDCSLFVPIICETKEERDKLHKRLIDNEIYCPLHWPKSKDSKSNIYDLEISLICDQRYGLSDMEKIIRIIKEK